MNIKEFINPCFQESNSTALHKVWIGMNEFHLTDPDVLSPFNDVHIEKLRGGNYIYIIDTPSIDTLLDCGIIMGKEQFFPSSAAFGVQKGSPLRQLLSERQVYLYNKCYAIDNILTPRATLPRVISA